MPFIIIQTEQVTWQNHCKTSALYPQLHSLTRIPIFFRLSRYTNALTTYIGVTGFISQQDNIL